MEDFDVFVVALVTVLRESLILTLTLSKDTLNPLQERLYMLLMNLPLVHSNINQRVLNQLLDALFKIVQNDKKKEFNSRILRFLSELFQNQEIIKDLKESKYICEMTDLATGLLQNDCKEVLQVNFGFKNLL